MQGSKTESGQFRSIEMDDLEQWAESPLWDAEESQNRYQYPLIIDPDIATREGRRLSEGIPTEQVYRREQFVCALSPQSHVGPFRWAVDFLVPDGTSVVAALDGTVVEIQEHSDRWGDGAEYRDFLNYVTVSHGSGEFTQYCHLAKDSVSACGIRVGSEVAQGQQIAIVGKTGWTDRDHLHFIVFRGAKNESPFTFKSLQPQFA